MKHKTGYWIALWVILVVVTGYLAFGHGYGGRGYGFGHGWGHMGGWSDRYSEDGAPGWHGYGWGMMGDSGYGWEMGYPHGMMGHYGLAGGAHGMMSLLPQNMTTEQAKKIGPLQNEAEKNNLTLQQQRRELQSHLQSLYASDKRDWNAIRSSVKELTELQRKQMDASIDMQQKIDGLLTDNQRQEMMRPWRNDGWQRGR